MKEVRTIAVKTVWSRVTLGIAVGFFVSAPIVAQAATLPAATYSNSISITLLNGAMLPSQDTNEPTGGLLIAGANNFTYWGASTSNNYATPSLYAAVRGRGQEGAESSLTYSFQLVGNAGPVQMHVSAHGTANVGAEYKESIPGGTGEDDANANIRIFNGFDNVVFGQAISSFEDQLGHGLLSIDGDYTFQANTVYTVAMTAGVFASYGNKATAWIDPYFSDITKGYDLQISDGIGNSLGSPPATTPIPATLPLFTSALGGLGFLGWRRRRAA
jgi:hypothetical protein